MENVKIEKMFGLTRDEAQTLKSLLIDYVMIKENSKGTDMFEEKRMSLALEMVGKINAFEKTYFD